MKMYSKQTKQLLILQSDDNHHDDMQIAKQF